jgi:predicted small lipoprotein YifL
MRALFTFAAAAAAVVGLAACGERPQELGAKKSSAAPHQGTAAPGYASGGWKAGDAQSWEEHMRTRAQGQNEYSRATTN